VTIFCYLFTDVFLFNCLAHLHHETDSNCIGLAVSFGTQRMAAHPLITVFAVFNVTAHPLGPV